MKREFEKKFNAGSLDYIRKLSVIQNSIFGVDIQPIAVEIARLRCFLSLVIEEKVDDNDYNRGVNPLPNLDFKFIIANTLMELPTDSDEKFMDNAMQIPMFENQDHIAELKAVREEYFSANDVETKNELKLEFAEIQKAMFQETLANRKIASRRYQELSDWAPFSNKPTKWFDPEWMFGVKEGFDIVIGNPPYVLLQGNNKTTDIEYYKKRYTVASYKIDLFHLFFEKGIELLKFKGILSYISPNTYFTNKYIKPLRRFILNNCRIIRTVSYDKAFDSASVDTATIILAKEKAEKNTIIIEQSSNFIFYEICRKKQEDWFNDKDFIFNINVETFALLKDYINLGDICKTYFGIQAYDRKSSISTNKVNDNYKPFIDGADIHPYIYAIPQIYFNYLQENIKSGGDWDVYSKERIVVRQIGEVPIVGLCDKNILGSNTLYSIYPKDDKYDLKFVLACLNSSFIKNYWKAKYSDNKALFPKIKGFQLKELPIPIVKLEQQKEVSDFVNKLILAKHTNNEFKNIEKQIDYMVCKMYGWTEEEYSKLENNNGQTD